MGVGADGPCPLPTDRSLADVVAEMEDTGQAAWIVDEHWRFAYVTEDARSLWVDRDGGRLGSVAIGEHAFSIESLRVGTRWQFGLNTVQLWREAFRSVGGLVPADTEGGRDALRSLIHPELREVADRAFVTPCAGLGSWWMKIPTALDVFRRSAQSVLRWAHSSTP